LLIAQAQRRHNIYLNQVFPDTRKRRPTIAPDCALQQT